MLDIKRLIQYFMKVLTYLKSIKSELSRISFPTKKEVGFGVALVLIASIVASLFFFLVDSVIYRIIGAFLNI